MTNKTDPAMGVLESLTNPHTIGTKYPTQFNITKQNIQHIYNFQK
jgi:hypothetical protein